MFDRNWLTMDREPVVDLVATIRKEMADGQRAIHVGTDAQKIDRKVDFVTCVAVLKTGGRAGHRVFYTKTTKPSKEIRGLAQKLLTETQYTIEVAQELVKELPEDTEFVIHVDVNPNVKWESSRHIKEVVGWVLGSGFQHVLTKPDAWLASHACDHAVKGKNAR
jgi:predicted RNase H-related nuclease YkuK (DUF458 family)